VYVFDYKNNYDKLRVPDIPRPTVRYSLSGEIRAVEDGQKFDEIDLIIAVARSRDAPESYQSIADRVGRSKSTVMQRARKLRKLPYLLEAMK
jgi:hypothetical protein